MRLCFPEGASHVREHLEKSQRDDVPGASRGFMTPIFSFPKEIDQVKHRLTHLEKGDSAKLSGIPHPTPPCDSYTV